MTTRTLKTKPPNKKLRAAWMRFGDILMISAAVLSVVLLAALMYFMQLPDLEFPLRAYWMPGMIGIVGMFFSGIFIKVLADWEI